MTNQRERTQSLLEAVGGVRENISNVSRAHTGMGLTLYLDTLAQIESLVESLETELENDIGDNDRWPPNDRGDTQNGDN